MNTFLCLTLSFQNDRRKTLDSPSKLQNNSSEDDFMSPTRTSAPETDGRRSLAMAAQREDVRERERRRWREFTERKSNMLRLRKHKQTPAEPSEGFYVEPDRTFHIGWKLCFLMLIIETFSWSIKWIDCVYLFVSSVVLSSEEEEEEGEDDRDRTKDGVTERHH